MEMENKHIPDELLERASFLYDEGKTLSFVAVDGDVVGVIGFSDRLKDDSIEAIRDLHTMGKQVIMITGDNERTAEAIARGGEAEGN